MIASSSSAPKTTVKYSDLSLVLTSYKITFDGKLGLKYILEQTFGRMWSGVIGFGIRNSDRLCKNISKSLNSKYWRVWPDQQTDW